MNTGLRALFCISGFLLTPFASGAAKTDFNGDGWGDLAIRVPNEVVNGHAYAGAINILYGSSTGLSANASGFIHQDGFACPDVAETGDRFGYALATGDFNNDGKSDLAVGAPYESVGAVAQAGVVHIFYGFANGLSCFFTILYSQSGLAGGVAQTNDFFGQALAAGDFDNDGYEDLAIGAPGDKWPNSGSVGSVTVLYGGNSGLTSADAQRWTLNSTGVPGTAASGDKFGCSLAVGNFGNGAYRDLAIGIRSKKVGTAFEAGAVAVLYGSNTGLSSTGSQFWTQDSAGILEVAESGDQFGIALAAGNFGKTLQEDLAIGASGENGSTGVVHVLYGSTTGLQSLENQLWPGALADDRYGEALVAADFGHSEHADLAIGAPSDHVGTSINAGSVQILYGTASGLSLVHTTIWTLANAAPNEQFGASLAAADFGNGPYSDLAAGIPGRDIAGVSNAGAVLILSGSRSGAGFGAPSQTWSQDSPNVLDSAEPGDQFGFALSR